MYTSNEQGNSVTAYAAHLADGEEGHTHPPTTSCAREEGAIGRGRRGAALAVGPSPFSSFGERSRWRGRCRGCRVPGVCRLHGPKLQRTHAVDRDDRVGTTPAHQCVDRFRSSSPPFLHALYIGATVVKFSPTLSAAINFTKPEGLAWQLNVETNGGAP